jgi:FkbM family methyltransferase
MNLIKIIFNVKKLLMIISNPYYLHIFLKYGVAASVEHGFILKFAINTLVDVGANKGQFSLLASRKKNIKIFAFEPNRSPASVFKEIFLRNKNILLFQVAIGDKSSLSNFNISNRDDSSSLYKITKNQTSIFPGTHIVRSEIVAVKRLDKILSKNDIKGQSLLKIDVQGFEYNVLIGCGKLLNNFKYIYCECSFVELYLNQKKTHHIISFLNKNGFILIEIFNPILSNEQNVIQADFLFMNTKFKI